MDDLISRQAAIDALAKNMPSWTTPDGSGQFDHDIQVTDEAYVDCMQIIHDMPSAQPERIIRCKDCKHWIPYDWMFSEVWRSKNMADYSEDEIGCNYCDMTMKANDFCSRAERYEVTE